MSNNQRWQRRKPRSPTSLVARGAGSITDARLLDVQRRDRWQNQPLNVRRDALNRAKQKRSIRKIDAQLKKERDRLASLKSQNSFQDTETEVQLQSTPEQKSPAKELLPLKSSSHPLLTPTVNTTTADTRTVTATRTTNNTTNNTTATPTTEPPLSSTHPFYQQPKRTHYQPSLPYDGEDTVAFETRMHEEYLRRAKLRHSWGNIPDPWTSADQFPPLPRTQQRRSSVSRNDIPGRVYRNRQSFPWESREGWDEPQVTFQKNSKVPSIQWYTNRPSTSIGTHANYSKTRIEPATTIPDRANRTWRSGPGRDGTAGRTAVPTPKHPSNVRYYGSEKTLEHLNFNHNKQQQNTSPLSNMNKRKTITTSVDVARERLKVLDAQAVAFGPDGECVDQMLSRGILYFQPDESVMYDRHTFWLAKIQGPEGSPYETSIFNIRIVLGKYPTRPPSSIVFTTPIYHPAIAYGHNKALKIHWGDGVAHWNHRFTLLAVIDMVLHLLRNPAAFFTVNNSASDLYVKDLKMFGQCAGQHAVKDAKGHGMSQKELHRFEDRVRLFQHEADMPPQALSGAYVQRSGQMNGTQYEKQLKINIAGHRMILYPSYGTAKIEKKSSGFNSTGVFSGLLSGSRRKNYSNQMNSLEGRRFNDGSRWFPGRRTLGSKGGFVKAKSTDRHFTPANGIIALGSTIKVSQPKQRPSTAGPIGSFDLRKWMGELSHGDSDEEEEGIGSDTSEGSSEYSDENSREYDGENNEGFKSREDTTYKISDIEEESLPSGRSDISSGIDLDKSWSDTSLINKTSIQNTLESTRRMFDQGNFEDSLESYRNLLAGKEEASCRELGSANVVRAMMHAVQCYGQTMA
jgi:ubiquitin-protein ligase